MARGGDRRRGRRKGQRKKIIAKQLEMDHQGPMEMTVMRWTTPTPLDMVCYILLFFIL